MFLCWLIKGEMNMMHGLSIVKIWIYILIGLPNHIFLKIQWQINLYSEFNQYITDQWLCCYRKKFRSSCCVPGIDIWSMSVALFEYKTAQWNSFGLVRTELIGTNCIGANSLNVSRTVSTESHQHICCEEGCGYCLPHLSNVMKHL
jgi:hypothetical protein